tara:strand:+ start:656 stop:880 length:225 start_codon:yes stop_codon:yes gene_type:complete
MSRHHVQIFEPADMPLMFHGIFYGRELQRYQVCPLIEGKLWDPLPLKRGDALAEMAKAYLLEVEDKSVSKPLSS